MKKTTLYCLGTILVTGFIVFLLWMLGGEIYLWSENKNFEELREKAVLNCDTLPLHCAVQNNDLVLIEELVSSGADLELRDNFGSSVLFWAVKNGKYEISESLIKLGSDTNTTDDSGQTVFHFSVTRVGNVDGFSLAELLLNSGVDIDELSTAGYGSDIYTALHTCVTENNKHCTEFLLLHGAGTEIKDSYGYTVIERLKIHTHIREDIKMLFNSKTDYEYQVNLM